MFHRVSQVSLVALLVVGTSLAACADSGARFGEADARRLDIKIEPASGGSAFDGAQAIALANANMGFLISDDLKIDSLLARVKDAENSKGHPTGLVWIVRYSGVVPVAFPEPSSEVAHSQPILDVRYGYVLIDAVTGEVLEITFTGP